MNVRVEMPTIEPAPGIGDNFPPPPTLAERLLEEAAETQRLVDALADRANSTPRAIKTPTDLDRVGTIVKDARKLWKTVDGERAEVKKPYLDASNEVQAFYAVFLDRLKRIGDIFQAVGDDYQREQARLERAKAEIAAQAARAEEQRQLEIARAAATPAAEIKANAKADAASDRAFAAEAVVATKAADLVRTRTGSGLVASARENWKGTITSWADIDLVALKPYLKREAVEAALNQAVRMGVRSLQGADIRKDTKAAFR